MGVFLLACVENGKGRFAVARERPFPDLRVAAGWIGFGDDWSGDYLQVAESNERIVAKIFFESL
jgi:hypothetical protein